MGQVTQTLASPISADNAEPRLADNSFPEAKLELGDEKRKTKNGV